MVLGSIVLVVVDMVVAHCLVAIDHAVLEAAAYISPSILTV